MSWQCPTCKTTNPDFITVCPVCKKTAPVIEAYLTSESVKFLRQYNSKLDLVHRLEEEGKYQEMFDTAMEAMALYPDDKEAVEKAKIALRHLLKEEFEIGNLVAEIASEDIPKEVKPSSSKKGKPFPKPPLKGRGAKSSKSGDAKSAKTPEQKDAPIIDLNSKPTFPKPKHKHK